MTALNGPAKIPHSLTLLPTGDVMKIHEMKGELEKVAKFVPELRKDLDDAYASESGKKSRIKLLWKEYEPKYKELSETREFRNLQ